MAHSKSKRSQLPAANPVTPSPKQESPAGPNGKVVPELNSIFRALDLIAQRVVVELEKPQEPMVPKNWRQYLAQFASRRWTNFVKFAKDVGPFFTGLGSICVSIMIGLATAYIAYSTYTFNKEQAKTNRLIERTAAVADFTDDEKKRNVAAIKLAAYSEDAFPFIKVALGLDDEAMRKGGVQTLQIMYQTQADIRTNILTETEGYFKSTNPTLSFGALKFYSAIAPELTEEKQRLKFVQELNSHFGGDAGLCSNNTGAFVLEAVTFLAACRLNDVKKLLLDIAQNCPHEGTNPDYAGARIHAINMLSDMIEKQHLPKSERDAIVTKLRGLKADASGDLSINIDGAITRIEGSKDP
jgi:hypothetical protein